MRQTITEKILTNHSNKKARVGDIVICDVDFCFGQDATTALIIDSFNKLEYDDFFRKDKFCIFMDHSVPSSNIDVSMVHKLIKDFSEKNKIKLFNFTYGISHQIIVEKGYVSCGDLFLGADSHTITSGALNVLSTGVGSTDLAIALISGKTWFRVPDTIKIVVNGKLPKGVYSKDVILKIISDIGSYGANYKAIEFYGEVIDDLSVDARFTITNMAVEMGAKFGIMQADKKTKDWIRKHSVKDYNPVEADEKAYYKDIREYDFSDLSPQVAKPHAVDNVCDIEQIEGIVINQAYIGTCTNGRLEDLEIVAKIMKGKKVCDGVKVIITPASKNIYIECMKKGFIDIFIKAGAIVNNPGCGACVGAHQGVLADEDVVISTGNRNFKGRMGNPNASIYLASPAVVAASALEGKIVDPRKYKRKL